MRRLPALTAICALSAWGTALASETEGPMATAGASGAPPVATAEPAPARTPTPESEAPLRPMTTAEQIDAFIKGSPAAKVEAGELADAAITPDRRVHGEVSVGIGTHGYRSVHMRTEMPVGKSGWISLSAGQTEGRGLYPGCYGPGAVGPWDGPGCGPVFGY